MKLQILYRGPLSSCNYGCEYCPFAKKTESREELSHDQHCLSRFTSWVREHPACELGILFTPWGEALVRRWYREAMTELSHLPHVRKVAVQTNLSCRLDWVDACNKESLALWCTYHPTEVRRERFLGQCQELSRRGVRYSVGVVGLREHFDEIQALRSELPTDVYLWVNAYKRLPGYYRDKDVEWLTTIDPLFPVNNRYHPSLGMSCRAGSSVIAVDGEGWIRRCHFIPDHLGNLYDPGFEACLQERTCTNATCGCHIGYVHLDELGLYEIFGAGVLERIPELIQIGMSSRRGAEIAGGAVP